MSEQAYLWSRYHAAAMQRHGPEAAAGEADKALAEYNKRFEVLSKLEAELVAAYELLRIRDEQVAIGTQALMVGSDMWESFHREGKADAHWFDQMANSVRAHLRLVGHRWTIVLHGMDENDPKLQGSR